MGQALDERAVAAACEVAASLGVKVRESVVLHSGSNVVVHLRPAPLVARVMSGTVVIHDDPRRWLQREVSVLAFLVPTGLAVRPSRLLDPGPHLRDGLWITFTELVRDVQRSPAPRGPVSVDDARFLGRELRRLHEALAPFSGDLSQPPDLRTDITRLLDQIQPVDERQRDRISALGEALESARSFVFESELPVQALHGDVSITNLLRTRTRTRTRTWNDFEDTFRGPVHWDVSSMLGDLRHRRSDPRAVRAMLDAYGWGEESELGPFLAAHDVYDEVWRMYDHQRWRS